METNFFVISISKYRDLVNFEGFKEPKQSHIFKKLCIQSFSVNGPEDSWTYLFLQYCMTPHIGDCRVAFAKQNSLIQNTIESNNNCNF